MTDTPQEDPAAEPPPLELAPMRPLDSPPPDPRDPRWVYQHEVLGERVVVHVHGALSSIGMLPTVRIVNGEGRDLSGLFPELDALAELTAAGPFTIDGILTADNAAADITYRLAATDPADAAIRAEATPVSLVVRDLVHLDGRRVGDLPYAARRFLLTSRVLDGSGWAIPADHTDPADALLEGQALRIPMPHLLSRRLDSRYFPGMAGKAWLRTAYPILRRTEIVGWLDDRPGEFHHFDGVLVAGEPDAKGIRQVQGVRGGMTIEMRSQLSGMLAQLPTTGAPKGLKYEPPETDHETAVRWARPGVVATIIGISLSLDRLVGHPILIGVTDAT